MSVLPTAKGFGKQLSKDIDPQMASAGKSSGMAFGKKLGIAAVSGVAVAAAGFGMVLKTGFGEAMDASKGVAQLAAGIKSTGNAANVSVKGMTDLAGSIQGFSGQTDDSIVAAEQLLLTFTSIRNNGPDKIFDQATLAAANMAAKMGGDASSNAILLGKALNNPIQGISALTRVGVAFTDGQKASIKAMQEHGDVAGAQKIILKELETEFGGAAKAAGQSLPGQLAIAKRSFEDLSQTVVGGLLPAFSTGLSGINTFIKGVQASFEAGGISKIFTDLGAKISAAWPGIKAQLAQWGTALWAWIQDAIPPMMVKLGGLLAKLGTWFATVALPFIGAQLVKWGKAFVEWIVPMIPPFLAKLGNLLVSLGNWLLSTALPAIVTHLLSWGKAFVSWIVPMIPPVLLALGGLLLKIGWWILSSALPKIIVQVAKWAGAFLGWVAGVIVSLPGKLAGILVILVKWALSIPGKIGSALGDLGNLLFNKIKPAFNLIIKAWNLIPWHKDVALLVNTEFPALASAAETAAKRVEVALGAVSIGAGVAMDAALNKAVHAHPTRGPIKGSGIIIPKIVTGGGGVTTVGGGSAGGASTKILDALNLKLAVENQKKTLHDFTSYLSKDFISSIKDSGTKAADLIGKLVSGVDSLAKGFAATITDPNKQGAFNLASTKIVNALETKLLGFQSAFDAIQTAREKLKTNIADADSALKDAIKLRADAAGSIADLLSKPFGNPSELVKQLSSAEATGETIISGYNSMVKMVTDRFASIKGDKKDSLLVFLKDSTTKLLGLAKDRADTAKLLEAAQTKLEDAIKTKAGYADNLSAGLKSATLSFTDFIDKEGVAASPAGIIAGFKARLSAITNFSDNLKSLATRGLNQNLLDQIIGMGTLDGGALAASLAMAGSDQLDILNVTGDAISATADSLGLALSDKFYGQSVANAQSIVKGFTDTQAQINATMASITAGIAAEMSPLTNMMTSFGTDSALALLNSFKSQDSALIAQAASLGARMAQSIADALSVLRVASGGGDFGVAAAKAASAKLEADAAAARAAADAKATADAKTKAEADALLKKTETLPFNGATSDDIINLGKLIVASNKNTVLLNQTLARAGGMAGPRSVRGD